MKKSTAKASTPVSLGTKRTCPKCGVKFYDFNKKELNCPKCSAELDEQMLTQVAKIPRAAKKEKPQPVAVVPSDDGPDSGPDFESVDDLDDDDGTDDIEVVEEKEEDY